MCACVCVCVKFKVIISQLFEGFFIHPMTIPPATTEYFVYVYKYTENKLLGNSGTQKHSQKF